MAKANTVKLISIPVLKSQPFNLIRLEIWNSRYVSRKKRKYKFQQSLLVLNFSSTADASLLQLNIISTILKSTGSKISKMRIRNSSFKFQMGFVVSYSNCQKLSGISYGELLFVGMNSSSLFMMGSTEMTSKVAIFTRTLNSIQQLAGISTFIRGK